MRTLIAAGAATMVAAFGVSGCADTPAPAVAPVTPVSPVTSVSPADPGPLPPPEALADVMSRLADPAVPGTEKVPLLQGGRSPDAAALDGFAAALRDGGFAPVTVVARDLRWATPGDVLAVVTITAANPAAGTEPGPGPGEFSYPLTFHPGPAGWQLTRDSAEDLLAFGRSH